jgi:3-hydroxyacyl-[acyl-carrier-protein] dehydratase
MIINSDEIKNLLPHREPFLFVDKCEIIEVGIKGVGYRKFLPNEFFFKGHFPELPIVPGVILVEALAQTAGIVVSKGFKNEENKTVLFMSVSDAKFRKPVAPNDYISFEVEKLQNVKSVYKFFGLAKNNSTKVCEAKFSAMITNKSSSEIL